MKRIISIILVCSLMLSACSPTVDTNVVQPVEDKVVKDVVVEQSEVVEEQGQEDIFGLDVKGLDDEVLLRHIEDNIYEELVEELNNEDYFVENVEAVYYPKEYIEALSSNSKKMYTLVIPLRN